LASPPNLSHPPHLLAVSLTHLSLVASAGLGSGCQRAEGLKAYYGSIIAGFKEDPICYYFFGIQHNFEATFTAIIEVRRCA
jgi:hypothetical protein